MGFNPTDVPKLLFGSPKADTETRFDVALLCASLNEGTQCSNRVYLSYGITKMGHGSIFGLSDLKGVAQEQAELKVCETETYVEVSVRHLDGMDMYVVKNAAQTFIPLEKNKDYYLGHGDAICIGPYTFFVEIVKSQKATIQETFQMSHIRAIAQHAQFGAISSQLHIKGPKPQPFSESKPKSSTKTKATSPLPKESKKIRKNSVPQVAPSSVDNSPIQPPICSPVEFTFPTTVVNFPPAEFIPFEDGTPSSSPLSSSSDSFFESPIPTPLEGELDSWDQLLGVNPPPDWAFPSSL